MFFWIGNEEWCSLIDFFKCLPFFSFFLGGGKQMRSSMNKYFEVYITTSFFNDLSTTHVFAWFGFYNCEATHTVELLVDI